MSNGEGEGERDGEGEEYDGEMEEDPILLEIKREGTYIVLSTMGAI